MSEKRSVGRSEEDWEGTGRGLYRVGVRRKTKGPNLTLGSFSVSYHGVPGTRD